MIKKRFTTSLKNKTLFSVLVLLTITIIVSCSKGDSPAPATSPATITSVTSPTGTTSGPKNTVITISGTNFISDLSKIQVKVNGKTCAVLTATSTSITAQIPPACGTGIVELFLDGVRYAGPVFNFINSYGLISVTNGIVGYSDGPTTTAMLEQVVGISIDGNDNVYIAQYDKPRIRKVNVTNIVSTVAGDGTIGYVNAQGLNAKLGRMDFCAANASGIVYIGDETNSLIRKIDLSGNVTDLTSMPNSLGLIGIKVGKSGNIYVGRGNYINKYSPSGTLLWSLLSHGTGNVDGDTSIVQFNLNGGIEIDSTETNIYLSEFDLGGINAGGRIKKLDLTTKTITTIAGDGTKGETTGPALSAKFSWTYSMALDKTGGLYIADGWQNNRIAYLKDGVITTIIGSLGPGDVDGDPSVAKIKYPTGLAFDSKGNLFIGCVGNNKLKKLVID